ncbi:MAG: YkvA family protein [Chloroflexota bacterium]
MADAGSGGLIATLRRRARALKTETLALYLVARDPRVPWYARLFVAGVVAYALSPIDLIPDFIPVIGYLDDLVLVPLGIALALRMVPRPVLEECRARAELAGNRPTSRAAMTAIIGIWLLSAGLAAWLIVRAFYA